MKWFTEDFLQGIALANLAADEIGVYAVVLNLIAARGGAIEDDPRWIAARAGCKSTRHANIILTRLADTGKISRVDGQITNPRMIAEVQSRTEKSERARAAANERWDRERGNISIFQAGKKRDKIEKKAAKNEQDPQETAISDDAKAYATRARDSELRESNLTHPIGTEVVVDDSEPAGRDGISRIDDQDLRALYQAVADASGHNPVSPGQIDRAFRFVQNWRDDGIDFEAVVLPAIRATVAASSDPTRTLGRFDARIRHEHARRKATPMGKAYKAPASPILTPDDEDEAFQPLRAALLDRLGPNTFATYINPARFIAGGDAGPGRSIIKIDDKGYHLPLSASDLMPEVRAVAKRLGFTDVW